MDVVYIVREDDDNPELRLSLRSLANLEHDRVWLVGHKPPWVTGVAHVPVRQGSDRWANARALWIEACRVPEISDEFTLMNDDFYIMAPLKRVPLMHRGTMADLFGWFEAKYGRERMTQGPWRAGLWKAYNELGPDAFCFEVHAPMVVRKDLFGWVVSVRSPADPFRTFYGAVAELEGEWVRDPKVGAEEGLRYGERFWSSREQAVLPAIGACFPEPSPYELT